MNPRARILLFTGNGKGKTTAALGMALRACGHDMRTLVLQFVKNDAEIGEIRALRRFPKAEVHQCGLGFLPPRSPLTMEAHRSAAEKGLRRAARAIASNRYQLVVLDEICLAVSRGVLDEKDVVETVGLAPAGCCVVLTGRGATKGIKALADTVTEMRCLKHGMRAHRPAQKGVEF